ncbi:MAG: MarR family transcriptional regulator [Rhodospirillales bacterium]|nr:MarR family transcriptional regulator [Rhodospirillales bacterium]
MKPADDKTAFRLFTEIGIIEQLSRNQLERNLPNGLKVSQFTVLNHLMRLGGDWSPVRLASAFQVTKGAMTNTIQRLEKRGLVMVVADPNDGRGKLVSITEAGLDMCQRCLENVGPLLADLLKELPDKDIAAALSVLEKVRKYLDTHRS